MKSKFTKLLVIILCLVAGTVAAQVPAMLNYQGAARNSSGSPLSNKLIALRISILDGNEHGTVQYSESRSVRTNAFGLYSIQIGSSGATASSGSIAAINWAGGKKWMQVELDPENGSNFVVAGASQLLSVPYALYAANSPAGQAGPKGETGQAGEKGEPGPKGDKGDKGDIGTVTSGQLDSHDLDIEGGKGATLRDVLINIKNAAVTTEKLGVASVTTEKIKGEGKQKILATDTTGKVLWQDQKTYTAVGPWFKVGTHFPATSNIEDIYQFSRVGVLTYSPVSSLDVRGSVRFGEPRPDAGIGYNSAAFGENNEASGINSAAFGVRNAATGNQSSVFGTDNIASGTRSTVFGTLSNVSGGYSTSFGSTNKVPAYMSIAMGGNLISTTDYQILMGVSNAFINGENTLLQLGNGNPNVLSQRSNALTIMKDGSTGVGHSTTLPHSTLQVYGSVSAKIRPIYNYETVTGIDYTLLVRGNIVLPVPNATNEGRLYHLTGDSGDTMKITGNIRISGQTFDFFYLEPKPGSRGITVQSDGKDWVLIGQF